MGLSTSLLQRREVTHNLASTLFWINIESGGVDARLAAAGPLVARLYGESPLTRLTAGFAATVFLASLATSTGVVACARCGLQRLPRMTSVARGGRKSPPQSRLPWLDGVIGRW